MSTHNDALKKKLNKIGYVGLFILVISYLYQISGITVLDSKSVVIGETKNNNIVPTEKDRQIYYEVTKVTDGDTLHLNVNNIDETIRLIGINTPETVDPRKSVQCFGKEATERMRELVGGKMVSLEFDDSQDLYDTYNRLLAYVYLEDGQMLNRKMIAEGYAYEYTYLTPYKYQKEFKELQNLARVSGRGLWASDTCAGEK